MRRTCSFQSPTSDVKNVHWYSTKQSFIALRTISTFLFLMNKLGESMAMPQFKYHPDPIATGSIVPSDLYCRCCDQPRGYLYAHSVWAEHIISEFCPWCIADGSAAERFDLAFNSFWLAEGISDEIYDEIAHRTPGIVSWDDEEWLSCCSDACEFRGLASHSLLTGLAEPPSEVLTVFKWTTDDWADFLRLYALGRGSPVHHFTCRHCRRSRFDVCPDF